MKLKKKLPAAALLSTLTLALIMSISCSILLLGLYHFKYLQVKDEISERLDSNLSSAIVMALADDTIYYQPVRDSLLLFDFPSDSVYFNKEVWGMFPSITITAVYKNRNKKRSFLYGASGYTYSDAVLYLTDHDRPLSLTGETYIEGKAYLPKSGLRSGFFDQKGFSRKKLIEGTTDSSKKTLPSIDPNYTKHFKIIAGLIAESKEFPALNGDTSNSFTNNVLSYKTNSWGILSNRSLAGKIIVVSDSVLEADAGSHLRDIVLVAPFIHFKEGFTGSIQAFALDSITIDPGCHLKYPSVVAGVGRRELLGNTGASITVHEGSTIEGIVISLAGDERSNIKPIIKIKKGSLINGLVFNEGYTYLNGKVAGAVYTDFFFEQRGPMSMENILTDATIIQSSWLSMSNYFSFLEGAGRQKIIKWTNNY